MLNVKAWFSSLVPLPDVITTPGQYVTRCGEVVTITEASTRHAFACVGTYPSGVVDKWHKSGRLLFGMQTPNDIVKGI